MPAIAASVFGRIRLDCRSKGLKIGLAGGLRFPLAEIELPGMVQRP